MLSKKSSTFVITIVALLLSPVGAIACGCCSNTGDYRSGLAELEDWKIDELKRIRFARPALLYLTEAGMEEDALGVDQPKENYSVSSAFSGNVWRFTFRSGANSGVLELPLPKQMWSHSADLHDGRLSPGGGPSLYKEWRLEGEVKGSGIFKPGMAAPAKYVLVFQGRGNACDNPEDFRNWRLEVRGEKARFAFFGKLGRAVPLKQHHGSKPAMVQTAPDAEELTKLLNEFLAGASRNDPAIHDRFWAEDLIYTRSAGRRVSKADIMRDLKAAPAPKPDDPKTVYTAEDVRIQQYGDTAIVAFRLVATTEIDGAKQVQHLLNSGTFLKREGKWQVVNWQSTRMPRTEQENKADVAAAATSFRQALIGRDIKKFTAVTDESFVWSQGPEKDMTRKQLVDGMKAVRTELPTPVPPKETISLYGETAIVRGETSMGRYTMTLVNQGGVWKIVAMHSTN